jgi:hypothetical protein
MTIQPAQLFTAYEQTRAIVADHEELATPFAPVSTMFEDKKHKADAVVMVYGVYNAGKSTVINALLRRDAAPADDIPLTDKVTPYQWGSYTILDTPGVDAPIAHEDVTRAQMLKADAIIFVVDPLGTVEEARTLEVIIDMVAAGKQIYLVCNEKKPVSAETFIHLKDAVRSRLQALAAERGLADVLKNIPISKVNAKRALQGYLKDQPLLVELSEFPAFEHALDAFLRSIGPDEMYGRLQGQLVDFLDTAVHVIEQRSAPGIVKKYEKLLQRISAERARLARDMQREMQRHSVHLREASLASMRTAPEQCEQTIEALLHQAGEHVARTLQNEMQVVVGLVQAEIDQFDAALPAVAVPGAAVAKPAFDEPSRAQADMTTATAPNAAFPQIDIRDTVQQLGALAKPEHIVSGLKIVKSTLPKLMKGIGIKTMEKWGLAVVGKWLPYVGIAASVGAGLYSLIKGDPEAERLRQLHAEHQQGQERALQQMEDFARDLADGFANNMTAIVDAESAAFFDGLNAQLEDLHNCFSEKEQSNTKKLERVLAVRQLAAGA